MTTADGLVGDFITHDIRRGAARDIAHLSPYVLARGSANRVTMQILSHTETTFRSGGTQAYAGKSQSQHWNERVKNRDHADALAPCFVPPIPDLMFCSLQVDQLVLVYNSQITT